MTRFTSLLSVGMQARGHSVEVWAPKGQFVNVSIPKLDSKWFGYIDQYVVFPGEVRARLNRCPVDTLFVFIDNALGPWIPLVASRPHVIHCHDFLAQRSALGQISENQTSWTGKLYQNYIRRGYLTGKHFIADSLKTQIDLHQFLGHTPDSSEMVYVGLDPIFSPQAVTYARHELSTETNLDVSEGYLLHVGGNPWYKNRKGVIELYDALCQNHPCELPLLMIGPAPTVDLLNRYQTSPFNDRIVFLTTVRDEQLRLAYAGASVFLFPSLAEGFGWPIAEAMAMGCPVITTNEEPMTEVGGKAGIFINRRPADDALTAQWATESAKVIYKTLSLPPAERDQLIERGIQNARRFNADAYLDQIEQIYQDILSKYD